MDSRSLIIQTRSIFASGIHGGLPTTYLSIRIKSQLTVDSLRLFEIELNGSCFNHRWWPFCHKFIQDLLLGGAWQSHFIDSSSPQTYSESGLDAEKKIFPCRSLVSCKFSAGLWIVVVVDRFTVAIR